MKPGTKFILVLLLLLSGISNLQIAAADEFFLPGEGGFFVPAPEPPSDLPPGIELPEVVPVYRWYAAWSSGASFTDHHGTQGPQLGIVAERLVADHVGVGLSLAFMPYGTIDVSGPKRPGKWEQVKDHITFADPEYDVDNTYDIYLIEYRVPIITGSLDLMWYPGKRGVVGPYAGVALGFVSAGDPKVYIDWDTNVPIEDVNGGDASALLPTYMGNTWKITPTIGYRHSFRRFMVGTRLGYGLTPSFVGGPELHVVLGYGGVR